MPGVEFATDELRDAAMAGSCTSECASFDVMQLSMSHEGNLKCFLMSGREAQQAENIVKLFEQLSGRAATPEEIASVERELKEV